ncbi:hypothetical protein, partial, partial [Absidia glauca]
RFKSRHLDLKVSPRSLLFTFLSLNKSLLNPVLRLTSFTKDLKKHQVDSLSLTTQISRDAARIRATGRAATEIYEDLLAIVTSHQDDGNLDHLEQSLEKCRQLAVYCFATGKTMDQEAKEVVTKAIDLPPALQSFDEATDDDKDFMFTAEQEKQIYSERFNRQLLKQGSSFNQRPNGFGSGSQRRGRGAFRGTGRGFSNPQRGFFGKPRQHQPQPAPTSANPASNSSSNPHWPLSVIQEGFQVQWSHPPQPWFTKVRKEASPECNHAVQQFLNSGVIEIAPTQDQSFLSTFFTIQEPSKIRPILDCQKINAFVQCAHFKMEGVPALRDLLQPGDYMAKIDLKDAYTVVSIHPKSRQYLTFHHQGTVYQYKALPFGLRDPIGVLSGRHLCGGAITDRAGDSNEDPSGPPHPPRVSNQLEEDQDRSDQGSGIPRLRIQHHRHEDQGTNGQAEEIGTPTPPGQDYAIMQVDCRITREDNSNDASDWGRLTQHTIHSAGSIQGTTPTSIQLEQAMSLVRSGEEGHLVVEDDNIASTGASDTPTTALTLHRHHLCRCFRLGMGHSITNNVDIRFLDQSGTGDVDQCQGTPDDLICSTPPSTALQEPVYNPQVRQHYGSQICDQAGRHIITDTPGARPRNPSPDPLEQMTISFQHIAGIQNVDADRLSRIKQPTYEWTLPKSWFRHICRHWKMRPSVDGFASRLNNKVPKFWSYQPDPDAQATDAFRQNWPSNGLYLYPPWRLLPQVLQKLRQDKVRQALQDFGRLDVIRKYYEAQGVVGPMSDMLSSPIRRSSASTYDSSWHRWVLWCLDQRPQVHPVPYNPLKVIAWLSAHPTLAYSTVRSHISGLASVWGAIHPEEPPVAKNSIIKRFLQARKRAPRPLPQVADGTWDVRLLLDHVANWGDTDNLDLVKLQDKTIILLTIGTMWRPRSDIGRLQCRDIEWLYETPDSTTIKGVSLVDWPSYITLVETHHDKSNTSGPSTITHIFTKFHCTFDDHFHQYDREPKEGDWKKSFLAPLVDRPQVCPVVALGTFLLRTQGFRQALPVDHSLFLTYLDHPVEAPRSIAPRTVAFRLKEIMQAAGVPKGFSPHSIRSASSTAAFLQGVSIESIKIHANWALSSNTFEKYYLRPYDQLVKSSNIVSRVFLGSAENETTSGVEAEASTVVVGTHHNGLDAEAETRDVVESRPGSS